MRRAYPQFMAAGGEDLPRDVLTVIFPLGYWDLIRKYAPQNATSIRTWSPRWSRRSRRSCPTSGRHANAVGLMQLMPPTARQYAAQAEDARTRRSAADEPPKPTSEMGTAYFADKIKRVRRRRIWRWPATTPAKAGVAGGWPSGPASSSDEFIDDIPYPETQNYVKRILGTAEDYRRLYGSTSPDVEEAIDAVPAGPRVASPTPS